MQAVVLAGGRGTRLHPLTDRVPKALIPVDGRPFLEIKLEQMRRGGVEDFVLCVGYLGEMIENHFGDGSKWRIRLRYSYDGPELLGLVGALRKALPLLEDSFFVTYGDNYLRLNLKEMMAKLLSSGKLGVMAVLHNRDQYGKSDVSVQDGAVIHFEKNSNRQLEWINYGIYALGRSSVEEVQEGTKWDEAEFFGNLIRRRELLTYEVRERFYEIGTPDSLREFEEFMRGARRDG